MTNYLPTWPANYWPEDYWPEYGEAPIPVSALILPTHYQSRGLTIAAYSPLATGNNNLIADDLFYRQTRYSHTLRAVGGYWSADLTIHDDPLAIEDWISNGLMRHIEVLNPSQQVIGEFFVNRITARMGRLTVSIGPAVEIINRIHLLYSDEFATEGTPFLGATTLTSLEDDAESQARYGILEAIVNIGSSSTEMADQQQSTILKSRKYPHHRENESTTNQQPSVQLELLGYHHLLNNFTYTSSSKDVTTISDKIQAVIAADPNSIFSSDESYIAANTTIVSDYEPERRLALDVINELIPLGDASFNRWLFAIYAGRKVHLHTIPTEIAYQKTIDSPQFLTPNHDLVDPWDVTPGKWLEYTDINIGEPRPADLTERAQSVRFPFIETVTFTAPDQISYSSGPAITAAEILAARFGLSRETQ